MSSVFYDINRINSSLIRLNVRSPNVSVFLNFSQMNTQTNQNEEKTKKC